VCLQDRRLAVLRVTQRFVLVAASTVVAVDPWRLQQAIAGALK
jgi:hypothetical protein